MIRETTNVLLPVSGYTAQVVKHWTFEDRTFLASLSIGDEKVGDATAEKLEARMASLEARKLLEFQYEMTKRAVLTLTSPEGVVESGDQVVSLPAEDIDFIFAEAVVKIGTVKKNLATS